MSSWKDTIRERRAEWRREGTCTRCGKRPAFGNYKRCEYCIETEDVRGYEYQAKNRERINARRRELRLEAEAEGRCIHCFKENSDPSRKTCPACRAAERARYLRRYTPKVRPEGVCLRCDRAVEPGRKLCEVHRAFAAAAGEKGRAAQDRQRHPWRLDEQARRAQWMRKY
jgi:hypothetical protein